jgi:hypothetical protein
MAQREKAQAAISGGQRSGCGVLGAYAGFLQRLWYGKAAATAEIPISP